MPNKEMANAAVTAATNQTYDLIAAIIEIVKMAGPFITVIIGLLVYTWSQREKTQDKLEVALVNHVAENDDIHDKLFTEVRDINHRLDTLLGEHHREMIERVKNSEASHVVRIKRLDKYKRRL